MRQKMKATGSDALAFGQPICGAALLAAWERGIAEPPPVLTLLRAGYPGLTEEEAAALPGREQSCAADRLSESERVAARRFHLLPHCWLLRRAA